MAGLAWEAVRDEFAFDGSWRDIYVLGTNMAEWQRMLDGLRTAGYDLGYTCLGDDRTTQLPTRVEDAFPLEGECLRLLTVRFGGVEAKCHFFTPEEIEFDIDPRDVSGQAELNALFGFMQCLATSIGREVILCPEACSEIVIFRMLPDGTVEHQAFGGWHDWR
jgi:hypothetical protein